MNVSVISQVYQSNRQELLALKKKAEKDGKKTIHREGGWLRVLSGAAMSATADSVSPFSSLCCAAINRPAAAILSLVTIPNTVVDEQFFLQSCDLGLKEATIRYRGEDLMECPLWGSTPAQTHQNDCFTKRTD